MWNKILLAAAVSFLSARLASATVVNVDFNATDGTSGTYNSTAVAPDPGTIWNAVAIGGAGGGPFSAFTSVALLASDGSATPYTVTLGAGFNAYDVKNVSGQAGVAQPLLDDFAYSSATFSINNLPVAGVYDLYIYSGGGVYGNTSTFTVTGAGSTSLNGGPYASFDDATVDTNGNYVVYTGLTGGSITGSFGGSNNRFSGFQLVVFVPEPASICSMALGSLMLIRRRRARS